MAEREQLAGRYAFRQELGRGASGRVILVADTSDSDALRAIKLVSPEQQDRLRWEFDLLAAIAHPNLARVFELLRVDRPVLGFEIAAGSVALVEQFAPGQSVDRVVRSKPARSSDLLKLVLWVAESVARALSAIHAQGLLHGDVKPGNVVVFEDDRSCKLIDLGLARPYGARGRVAGTPEFMAPETWLGETSSASDIYALGVTVLQVLQGARESTTKESLGLSEHLAKALSRGKEAHGFADWIPASLKRVLAHMLASDPSDRLQSAREVAARFSALYTELFASDRRDRIGGGADDVATPTERAMAAHLLPFEGHEQALKRLVEALTDARNDTPDIIAVIGPSGSGRSRLIREAVRRVQTAGVASARAVASYRAALALPAEAVEHDIVVHLEQADAIELSAVRAYIRSTTIAGKRAIVILERQNTVADELLQIELKPLSAAAIERLLNAAITPQIATPALVEAAQSASGGLSGRLCRTLIEGLTEGLDLSRPETLLDLAYKQQSEHHFIPESAREFVSLLACCGGSLSMRLIGECLLDQPCIARGVQTLLVHGLATEGRSGRIVLRPDLVTICSPSDTVLRLIDRLLTSRLEAANRGYLFAAKGDLNRAFQGFIDAIHESRFRGDPENAARLAEDALQRLSRVADVDELYLAKADAQRACGRYQQALQTLEDQSAPQAAIQRAELHRLRGDLPLARREADAAFESARSDAEASSNIRALLARIAFDSTELEQAVAFANDVSGDKTGRGARTRSLGSGNVLQG